MVLCLSFYLYIYPFSYLYLHFRHPYHSSVSLYLYIYPLLPHQQVSHNGCHTLSETSCQRDHSEPLRPHHRREQFRDIHEHHLRKKGCHYIEKRGFEGETMQNWYVLLVCGEKNEETGYNLCALLVSGRNFIELTCTFGKWGNNWRYYTGLMCTFAKRENNRKKLYKTTLCFWKARTKNI